MWGFCHVRAHFLMEQSYAVNIFFFEIRSFHSSINIMVFWDVKPCSLMERYQKIHDATSHKPVIFNVFFRCCNLQSVIESNVT
jgi:hypothetical protein